MLQVNLSVLSNTSRCVILGLVYGYLTFSYSVTLKMFHLFLQSVSPSEDAYDNGENSGVISEDAFEQNIVSNLFFK